VPDGPLRVMADTNVLVSGVIFPRAAYEFLQHALRGDFTLVLSEQILAEVVRPSSWSGTGCRW
jgi:predicted nucleic acid-binding protein